MDEDYAEAEEITFELVLMDSAPLPYTFDAFHQYLEKKVKKLDLTERGARNKQIS